tara:strand:+ start:189 stop:557 length:369 start_codon:yes stop_codon:yes gene_type:complete
MKTELNKKRNEISEMSNVSDISYESIFNVYKDDDFYGYNILKTVQIPQDIDHDFIEYIRIDGKMAWVTISNNVYGTIQLWWLICVTNKILNPVLNPSPGTIIKVIKPEYVADVITSITQSVK